MFKGSTQDKLGQLQKFIPLICVLVMVGVFFFVVVPWTKLQIDNVRYGYPRTTKLSFDLNPTDATNDPTLFIGTNVNRRVSVLAISSNPNEKAQQLEGPRLFGVHADRIPVRLIEVLANNDPFPDLIVDVDGEQVLYIAENGTLRLSTVAERETYQRQIAGPAQQAAAALGE